MKGAARDSSICTMTRLDQAFSNSTPPMLGRIATIAYWSAFIASKLSYRLEPRRNQMIGRLGDRHKSATNHRRQPPSELHQARQRAVFAGEPLRHGCSRSCLALVNATPDGEADEGGKRDHRHGEIELDTKVE
jgi:hypothetical protein